MTDLQYIFRPDFSVDIITDHRTFTFNAEPFELAVVSANRTMHDVAAMDVPLFTILGMRNLSAFVGEVLALRGARVTNGLFISNPHQNGYPIFYCSTLWVKVRISGSADSCVTSGRSAPSPPEGSK